MAKDEKGDRKSEDDMVVFQMVVDHFKQDTREFWTRANFYLVAQAGLFSAFIVAYPGMVEGKSLVILSIPILGLAIAITWFIVLRGAMTFLRKWRDQVIRLDAELDRFHCYVDVESQVNQQPLSSPSYITQFLPVLFCLSWAAILAFTMTALR